MVCERMREEIPRGRAGGGIDGSVGWCGGLRWACGLS